jgi:hypothetical protein
VDEGGKVADGRSIMQRRADAERAGLHRDPVSAWR